MIPKEVQDSYEPTIGIECHVQLHTATKLFTAASNDERGQQPNTTVSPICFGLPGTLPVLNKAAVELAVRAGLAMDAVINKNSSFDRKHYFYPDLPKGYQITQLYRPIIGAGSIVINVDGRPQTVRIHHAHLEEDAGKSSHPAGAPYSLVDLNRAGTPLLEIVSEADMHSAAAAKAYAEDLYLLMKYAAVTRGNLQHGNMRFDVNVSVAKKGAAEWGTRVEVKNLNSFRAVERAVEYEVKRHIELIEKGGKITQETRGWVEATQKTVAQRSKEEAQDYRYMPEPDVPPIVLSDDVIAEVGGHMPQLPAAIRKELQAIGLDAPMVATLILQDALTDRGYIKCIRSVQQASGNAAAKFAANFIVNRDIAHRSDPKEAPATAEPGKLPTEQQFSSVFAMYEAKELSSTSADNLLFNLRLDARQDARATAEKLGIIQENNKDALMAIVADVLARPECQKAVQDVANGEGKAIGFLVGQVMKASKGTANPALAGELIRRHLGV